MTQHERAELEVLKAQMSRTQDDVKEIKGDIKTMLKKMESLDDKFITRREGNVLRTLIAILISAVSAICALMLANK
jgi:septal ring factor EnvC (AmiA/AmiB activator)